MSSHLEETVIEKLRELPIEKQQVVLEFVETLLAPHTHEIGEQMSASKTIWEKLEEITKEVPDEMWEQLPTDGAEQHDHYLYGVPKK
ncbi:MAG: hypothetical protein WCB68_22505 [Pyrinomonadaceae bacterium]